MGTAERFFFALLLKPFLIGMAAGIVFAFGSAFSAQRDGRPHTFLRGGLLAVAICVPVALIAYIAGYLTGATGSSATGNLVPAVLAFIGGFNVYLFGSKVPDRATPIYAIFLFALILFYGVLDGASEREASLETRLTTSAEQERRIRTLRKNLELPDDPPAWVTTSQ